MNSARQRETLVNYFTYQSRFGSEVKIGIVNITRGRFNEFNSGRGYLPDF